MKNLTLFVLSFFIFTSSVNAQNGYNTTTGARGLGMSDAVMGYQNIDAAFGNQAGLAFLPSFSIMATAQRRLALNELSTTAVAAAYPMNFGTFAVQAQYFGFENYNETKIGLAYARKLGKKIALGAQFSYLSTKIPLYGQSGVPVFEIGLHSEIIKNLSASAHIVSPAEIKINEDESLPTILRLGLTYRPSEKVLMTIQADKDIDYKARFRAGIEYKLSPIFRLRCGTSSHPAQVSFGFGVHLKNGLGIDAASAYHAQIGFLPGVGLRYALQKEK